MESVEIPISLGVNPLDEDNGVPLACGEPLIFRRSRASTSASENCRRCFGLNGFGVETRDVRNWKGNRVLVNPGVHLWMLVLGGRTRATSYPHLDVSTYRAGST